MINGISRQANPWHLQSGSQGSTVAIDQRRRTRIPARNDTIPGQHLVVQVLWYIYRVTVNTYYTEQSGQKRCTKPACILIILRCIPILWCFDAAQIARSCCTVLQSIHICMQRTQYFWNTASLVQIRLRGNVHSNERTFVYKRSTNRFRRSCVTWKRALTARCAGGDEPMSGHESKDVGCMGTFSLKHMR